MEENKLIVAFSHSNYLIKSTGTEKCMREMKDLLIENGIHTLQIFSFYNKIYRGTKNNQYIGVNLDDKFLGIYRINQLKDLIDNICYKYTLIPIGIHIHHLLNYSLKKLEEIILKINLPIIMFIHDYYTICSSSNLINSDNLFCGFTFPNNEKCKNCLYYKVSKEHIKHVDKFIKAINCNLKSIIVPSKYVYNSWTNLYDKYIDKTFIRSHLTFEGIYNSTNKSSKNKIKIGFVGGQLVNKGYNEWKKLVSNLLDKGDYEFYYFGTGTEKIYNVKSVEVSVIKDGPNAMINALRSYDIDLVLLWSLGPETYSYVYYEASAAGCCVISNTISGNIKTMILENKNGLIFKSIDEVIEAFNDINSMKEFITEFKNDNVFSPLNIYPNDSLDNIYINDNLEINNYNKYSKDIRHKKIITYIYKTKLNLK